VSGKLERYVRDLAAKAARLEVPQVVGEQFARYRDDPVGFVREVLGGQSATRRSTGSSYQFAILADLVHHPRVAVRSGHGVGKSALDAWAALWWLLSRPFSRVVVLAPEFSRQIRAVLFSEIRKWARRSARPLPVSVLAARVLVEGHGEEWSAVGMSTAGDVNRLEGFHAEGGVLVICDETKGIPQDAFDAVQGALTSLEDSRLLVTSVPGGAGAGPFWKVCQDPARWVVHHVPSTDSSLVAPSWCADRARDWGVGSPLYQTRVLGEFAEAGEGVLFPLPLLEAAMERPGDPSAMQPGSLGVDVARSVAGDLNVVARCFAGRLEIIETWRSPDLMHTVDRVLRIVATTGLRRAAVDVGGPGGGVADRLRQLGYDVLPVAFGGTAVDTGPASQVPASRRFRNRRAQLFWALREALERGQVALAEDDEVRADLAALRYGFTPDGRLVIEEKDAIRQRLGRSPDRADALALALAGATVVRAPGVIARADGPVERREEPRPVVPTVAVRIVKAIPGSPDGVTVERYQVGQEVTLPEGLAAVFLREGWATLTNGG
jgi:phage terminase large subunit